MAINALLYILIAIVIIVAVAYACFWIIQRSIPADMQIFAKLIVGVIAIICLLYLIVDISGFGLGHPLLSR